MDSNLLAKLSDNLSTEELSAVLKVKPQTVRAGLSLRGHYLGLHPVKLPNGRHIWSGAEAALLTKGGVEK